MKKARHVATGKLIDAFQAEYGEYYGIFECPNCKAALKLRKSHVRNGVTIGAAFVHPSGGTVEQIQCHLRVHLELTHLTTTPASRGLDSKRQIHNLLKRNLLRCLKNQSKIKILDFYIRYRRANTKEAKVIQWFIKTSNDVLKLSQNGKYIENQKSNIKYLIQMSKFNSMREFDEHILDIDSNKVIWCIQFLMAEADDTLRADTISYILTSFHDESMQIESRQGNITKVFGFNLKTLKSVQEILLQDARKMREFYIAMYKGDRYSETICESDFTRVLDFHHCLFKWLISYFISFNWYDLSKGM